MDNRPALDAAATLADWRARGIDRHDPVRLQLIQAMARRAQAHEGEARRVLDARLAELIEAYARDADGTACGAGNAAATPPCATAEDAAPGALARLVQYIAQARHVAAADGAPSAGPAPAELELLEYFRKTWTRLSTDRQLRQSQDQVPVNAGPLNSSHLAHRALSLMRGSALGYLQHFLSYLDTLAWMEQLAGPAAPEGPGKSQRKK